MKLCLNTMYYYLMNISRIIYVYIIIMLDYYFHQEKFCNVVAVVGLLRFLVAPQAIKRKWHVSTRNKFSLMIKGVSRSSKFSLKIEKSGN